MVTPRKLHPKQRGRKTANKMPMFVMRQNNKSNDDGKLLKFLEQFDDTGIAPMEQLTDQQMYDMNMAAAEQALQLTLKDPEQRDHFTKKLREDGWAETALSAVYHQQINSLDLQPWQTPPSMLQCDVEKFDDILAKPDPIGDYATVLLTTKLIRLGVSVYSPDPIDALKKAVKQARRGRPPR
jgi:hypothetical protein